MQGVPPRGDDGREAQRGGVPENELDPEYFLSFRERARVEPGRGGAVARGQERARGIREHLQCRRVMRKCL